MIVTDTGDYIEINNNFNNYDNINVAGFDLDFTLIKPKNGKKFSAVDDPNDWMFFNNTVVSKLSDLYKNGYQIVIISNQGGLKTKAQINNWVEKVKKVISHFTELPVIVYGIYNKECIYRKPLPYIWQTKFTNYTSKSFYCGDAAGLKKRVINKISLPADFSDTDAKFAKNCGVEFLSRDTFIIKGHIIFDNKNYLITYPILKNQSKSDDTIYVHPLKHLIIMIGFPGSGKSTICETMLKNYIRINSDTQSKKECTKKICEAIENKLSVVIDNTNPSVKTRKEYINQFKLHEYYVSCVHINTSREISVHNNIYRSIKNNVKRVPTIAYNIYNKHFEQPSLSEGFDKINIINYNLNVTDDAYYYYYF